MELLSLLTAGLVVVFASYLLSKTSPTAPKSLPRPPRANQASQEEKALSWAQSAGYAVPAKPNSLLWLLGITCGLFAAVVPGLLLILWLVLKQRDYDREVRQLQNKWIDAGRPQPLGQYRSSD